MLVSTVKAFVRWNLRRIKEQDFGYLFVLLITGVVTVSFGIFALIDGLGTLLRVPFVALGTWMFFTLLSESARYLRKKMPGWLDNLEQWSASEKVSMHSVDREIEEAQDDNAALP